MIWRTSKVSEKRKLQRKKRQREKKERPLLSRSRWQNMQLSCTSCHFARFASSVAAELSPPTAFRPPIFTMYLMYLVPALVDGNPLLQGRRPHYFFFFLVWPSKYLPTGGHGSHHGQSSLAPSRRWSKSTSSRSLLKSYIPLPPPSPSGSCLCAFFLQDTVPFSFFTLSSPYSSLLHLIPSSGSQLSSELRFSC